MERVIEMRCVRSKLSVHSLVMPSRLLPSGMTRINSRILPIAMSISAEGFHQLSGTRAGDRREVQTIFLLFSRNDYALEPGFSFRFTLLLLLSKQSFPVDIDEIKEA